MDLSALWKFFDWKLLSIKCCVCCCCCCCCCWCCNKVARRLGPVSFWAPLIMLCCCWLDEEFGVLFPLNCCLLLVVVFRSVLKPGGGMDMEFLTIDSSPFTKLSTWSCCCCCCCPFIICSERLKRNRSVLRPAIVEDVEDDGAAADSCFWKNSNWLRISFLLLCCEWWWLWWLWIEWCEWWWWEEEAPLRFWVVNNKSGIELAVFSAVLFVVVFSVLNRSCRPRLDSRHGSNPVFNGYKSLWYVEYFTYKYIYLDLLREGDYSQALWAHLDQNSDTHHLC